MTPSHGWIEFRLLDTSYSWPNSTSDSSSSGWIRLKADSILWLTTSCGCYQGHKGQNSTETDVVAFCPLKKCLRTTMLWLNCYHFSMSWCFSHRILMCWFFGLGISMSWLFGFGISMSWYMCLHGLIFVFILKNEKSRKIFWIMLKNISIIQIYTTAIRYKAWINELE